MMSHISSLRLWRRLALIAGIGLVVMVLALRLFAMSPIAHGLVESRLEELSIRGQGLDLTGLQGDLLGRVSIEHAILLDADGAWAEIHDIQFHWAPLALFSRQLRIKDISASQVLIQRRPEFAPSKVQGNRGGSFLRRYEVGGFSLVDLSLSEGVAGPSQAYALFGQFKASPEEGNVTLDLVPMAREGDEISAQLSWGQARPLQGQVLMEGAPEGLIATLLEVSPGQDVSAVLQASGSLQNWIMTASAMVGDDQIVDLTSSVENEVFASKGSLTLNRLGILHALRTRLGDTFSFDGTLDTEGRFSGQAEASTGAAILSGTVQTPPNGLVIEDLQVVLSDLNTPALTGQSDLSITELTAKGRLDLTDKTRAFTGDISIPHLGYRKYAVTDLLSAGQHQFSGTELSVDTQLSIEAL
ncbi:MAG: hypothetical protein AAGB16_09610, partial [Pseudomonadota bacterium]